MRNDGFDYLGFHVHRFPDQHRKSGYVTLIKPSENKIKETRQQLRKIWLKGIGKTTEWMINQINPIIRGKANYWNQVSSTKVFTDLDAYMLKRAVRFTQRQHPSTVLRGERDQDVMLISRSLTYPTLDRTSIIMNNPSLRQEPRYEPASVIPLKQDTSLLDWLEANNRLMPKEAPESENEKYLEEDEEIAQLMGEDYRTNSDAGVDNELG